MSVLLALCLFFIGWLLYESGYIFFGFIAIVAGIFALIANAPRANARMPRAGGEQKRHDAKHNPPASYQLARAGEGFNNLGKGIVWIFRYIFGLNRKK